MQSINAKILASAVGNKLAVFWQSDIRKVILLVIGWRFLLVWAMAAIFQKFPVSHVVYTKQMPFIHLLQATMQADSGLYYIIATSWYPNSGLSCLDAFYPLYPFALRLGDQAGIGVVFTGFLINLISTAIASCYLWLLARDYFSSKALAWRTLFVFLLFPSAVFLAAVYTESLFCATVFASMYYLSKRRWLAASLWIGLATAIRAPGSILIVVALIHFVRIWLTERKGKPFDRSGLWLLLCPVGIIGTLLYQYWHQGDALVIIKVYNICWTWRHFNPNVFATYYSWIYNGVTALLKKNYAAGMDSLVIVFPWTLGLISVFFLRKERFLFGSFALLNWWLIASFTTAESANRYALPIFPIYLLIVDRLPKEYHFLAWITTSAAWFGIWLCVLTTGLWGG